MFVQIQTDHEYTRTCIRLSESILFKMGFYSYSNYYTEGTEHPFLREINHLIKRADEDVELRYAVQMAYWYFTSQDIFRWLNTDPKPNIGLLPACTAVLPTPLQTLDKIKRMLTSKAALVNPRQAPVVEWDETTFWTDFARCTRGLKANILLRIDESLKAEPYYAVYDPDIRWMCENGLIIAIHPGFFDREPPAEKLERLFQKAVPESTTVTAEGLPPEDSSAITRS